MCRRRLGRRARGAAPGLKKEQVLRGSWERRCPWHHHPGAARGPLIHRGNTCRTLSSAIERKENAVVRPCGRRDVSLMTAARVVCGSGMAGRDLISTSRERGRDPVVTPVNGDGVVQDGGDGPVPLSLRAAGAEARSVVAARARATASQRSIAGGRMVGGAPMSSHAPRRDPAPAGRLNPRADLVLPPACLHPRRQGWCRAGRR